jgi:hypothetical protein
MCSMTLRQDASELQAPVWMHSFRRWDLESVDHYCWLLLQQPRQVWECGKGHLPN